MHLEKNLNLTRNSEIDREKIFVFSVNKDLLSLGNRSLTQRRMFNK